MHKFHFRATAADLHL